MGRRVAEVAITTECIRDVFGLPADAEIVGAKWDGFAGAVRLAVRSSEYPEITEGDIPPTAYMGRPKGVQS